MASLSHQLFLLFTALVEERAGLHYDLGDQALFADKLLGRLTEAGFDNPLDYYYFLRYDPAGDHELNQLVDALVVNETYLFREVDALTAAVDHVIRPAVEARGSARVWSAGCATGEEPFTLAMILADGELLDRVSIDATDISSRAIARARSGIVSGRGARALSKGASTRPPSWAERLASRWVRLDDGRGGTVDRSIVEAIGFRRESLLDIPAAPPIDATDRYDLVLCRNVLIYFKDDLVVRIVDRFAGRLRPETGRLVVGASESLLRFGTLLRCEERAGAFFYARDGR